MMRRPTKCSNLWFAALLAAATLPTHAALAQDRPFPGTTDVFSTLWWIEGSSERIWKGLDRGDGGLAAGVVASWGAAEAGSLVLLISGDGAVALGERSDDSNLFRLGPELAFRLTNNGDVLWIAGDGYYRSAASERALTSEISAGIRARVPWLPESERFIYLEANRDLHRYEATYLKAALQLDYKIGVRFAAFIRVSQSWSNLPLRAGGELPRLGPHATEILVTPHLQSDPATTSGRTRSIEPYIQASWSSRHGELDSLNVGVRVVAVPLF